jgi:hypothetical protein
MAAICAAYVLLPGPWLLWAVGGGLAIAVVCLTVHAVLVFRRLRRLEAQVAAMPPLACPACGGTDHDYKSQGLWDGMRDPVTGTRPHGSFGFGICKRCGSRWAQWDGQPPYVPADEEWDREVTQPAERRAAQLRQWPARG